MLARYSIRAKITIVVCFLLIAMSTMGGLAMKQMSDINNSTVEIARSWLPSVRVLGEIRAATITYRAIVRSHLLANTEAGKQAQEVLLKKWIDNVEKAHKRYEPLINSAEERAFYNESKAAWNEYLDGVKQILILSRKNEDNEARALHTKASLASVKSDEILQKDIDLNNEGGPGRHRCGGKLCCGHEDGADVARAGHDRRHRRRSPARARRFHRHQIDRDADAGAGRRRPHRDGAASGRED